MKKIIKKINFFLELFGFSFRKLFLNLYNLSWFLNNYFEFKNKNHTELKIKGFYPCLLDKNDTSGNSNGHYFHQDIHVSRKIFLNNPKKHIDIGSRIDGFVSNIASFREIEVFDIREQKESPHENIIFKKIDFTNIPSSYYNYTDSLSTLHTIEHIGLGRYGDKIDPNGHIIFFNNLSNVLNINGILYLSTPIGEPKIIFNAHRIFDLEYLLSIFNKNFELIKFAYVDDIGNFHNSININDDFISKSKKFKYSLGIFELKKIK